LPALFNCCVLNWFGDWSDSAFFRAPDYKGFHELKKKKDKLQSERNDLCRKMNLQQTLSSLKEELAKADDKEKKLEEQDAPCPQVSVALCCHLGGGAGGESPHKKGNEVTVQRMLHTEPTSGSPPKIMAEKMVVEERFLYTPPHRRRAGGAGSSEDAWWRRSPRGPTGGDPGPTRKEPVWRPGYPPDLGEDDLVWVPTNPTDPPVPADQRPRLRLRLPMQNQGGGGGEEDESQGGGGEEEDEDQGPLDEKEDENQSGGVEEEDEDQGPPDAPPLPGPGPDGDAEKARNREVDKLEDGLSTCFKPAGDYRTSRPPKRFGDQMDEPEQERGTATGGGRRSSPG
jgi:hypothetical protein